jgi:hypothetical protein
MIEKITFSSANPFSNSMSPLTVGDATELEDNPSSILSSSPTRLPSVPTEPVSANFSLRALQIMPLMKA